MPSILSNQILFFDNSLKNEIRKIFKFENSKVIVNKRTIQLFKQMFEKNCFECKSYYKTKIFENFEKL